MIDSHDLYAKHSETCAHLSYFAWQRFRHLPSQIATQKGERFDSILFRIWNRHDYKQIAIIRGY